MPISEKNIERFANIIRRFTRDMDALLKEIRESTPGAQVELDDDMFDLMTRPSNGVLDSARADIVVASVMAPYSKDRRMGRR